MNAPLEAVELLDKLAVLEARESFWAYRQYIHPKMKLGWWQREMAQELQQFYERLVAKERPKLVIEAPPQHGKSQMIVDFITWVAGNNPDLKTIYTSFSERLGVRANLMCQRIYDSNTFKKVFPETQINAVGTPVSDAKQATRNRELLEYIGAEGFFRNTTVRGSITGESLDLGVVDDPIKGREEAGSETVRDKTWDWFTDDFFTRFSDDAGLLTILTRWHIDDPIGRLRAQLGDEVRVVSYPAIAVRDERHRKVGEPLFPELKSLAFLEERKATMASVNWESLYQQNPQIVGGEIIKGEWFGRYKQPPIIKQRMVYADTAQKTAERNDFSVFECWGKGDDGKLYLLDLIRGKWEAPELERRAVAFWAKHAGGDAVTMGQLRQMKIEDKASGTGLIQGLKTKARIPVVGIERTKDKYTRLMDVLGYIESGYIMVPEDAPFTNDFVAECEAFTADDSHLHDDQVDPMMDAINDLLASTNAINLWEKMI
jgi:predicted phage terminase large subunit-like protein